MNVIYYETPELTILTCSENCTNGILENYAARGHVIYTHDDGTPLIESDSDTRQLIAAGELPNPNKCDFCYREIELTARVAVSLPASFWLEVHHALGGAIAEIGAYGEFQDAADETEYRLKLESAYNAIADAYNAATGDDVREVN